MPHEEAGAQWPRHTCICGVPGCFSWSRTRDFLQVQPVSVCFENSSYRETVNLQFFH